MGKKASKKRACRRELVCSEKTSHKFWKIELSGLSYSVTFGRIGTTGQTKTKDFDSETQAQESFDKLVASKLKKGYVEARGAGKKMPRAGKSTRPKPSPAGKKATGRITTVRQSWDIIGATLEEHCPILFDALARPATKRQIAKLERILGMSLPEDFVESLRIHNGMTDSYLGLNRFVNYEALLSAETIAEHWLVLKGLLDDGHFEGGGGMSLQTRKVKSDCYWIPGWIPITDADGDGHYLDLDPASRGVVGQVFRFRHDADVQGVVAKNYSEWLAGIASRMKRGMYEIDDDARAIWLE